MSSDHRIQLQAGYILHQYDYRDSSLLLEVLTHDYGRVGIVARGVKREKSKFHGVLQPFIPLFLSWSGRGELVTLSQAEPAGKPITLPGKRLLSGFYINELLMRLLPRYDPHAEIFELYELTVASLATENDEEVCLRHFECKLLQAIGYGLILDHEVESGTPIEPLNHYQYVLERGPVQKLESQPNHEAITISGRTLLGLHNNTALDVDARREAKRMMRAILAEYLGGKPMNSANPDLHKVL